jgi:hypothetical protein
MTTFLRMRRPFFFLGRFFLTPGFLVALAAFFS